jgi:hypothetical protein
MYKLFGALSLLLCSLSAEASLPFKKEAAESIQWLPYLFVVLILLSLLLFLAKYTKKSPLNKARSHVVETIVLHYKSRAYIVEYQGQRLLIADNQQAIAIHPLNSESAPS